MLQKARCIALHSIKYGDSSLIAHLYSYEFGRITLMVNGAYGKTKSSKKAIFFQPLNLINLIFYPSKAGGMGRLKEVSLLQPNNSVQGSHVKRAIALFLGEVIYTTIREEESNPSLFNFLEVSIMALDAIEAGVSNFHLLFIAQLSRYLGFFPNGSFSDSTPYFDYRNGFFVNSKPLHNQHFSVEQSRILSSVIETSFEHADHIRLNGTQRNEFINNMLHYYAFHNSTTQNVKSHLVLAQVFD